MTPSWLAAASVCVLSWSSTGWANLVLNQTELALKTGTAERLTPKSVDGAGTWDSSAPRVAEVLQNGFVIGLTPGEARIRAHNSVTKESAECAVKVTTPQRPIVSLDKLKQYPDARMFLQGERKCYGSELNG